MSLSEGCLGWAALLGAALAACSAAGSGSGTSGFSTGGGTAGNAAGSSTGSTGGASSTGGTRGASTGLATGGFSGASSIGTNGSGSTGSASGGGSIGAPDAGYTCPAAVSGCPAGSVSVAPGADLAALVGANPAGTTFCLQPGLHHDTLLLTAAADGDVFTSPSGTTADGVIENGAEILAGWTQVTLTGQSYWTTDAGAPLQDPDNDETHCAPGHAACFYPQALYVDGGTYQEATSLASVQAGSWYYEMDGLQTIVVAGAGHGYVVGDVLAVAGGTDGKVSVTAVSDAGGVADASIIHPGYDYPASATETTTETTSWQVPPGGPGSGTGCTLQITAGCGGVRDNVYLAASETPAAATVEIGVLPYFIESNVADDITIQGLIVEKYAGAINFAPVSLGWSGSNGTASGWRIQNNETRLNQHLGIHLGYGADGGHPDWVLCNWSHDNGQEGIGGGNNRVFVTLEGNTLDHNNAVHTANDYGCGGFKVGAADGMLVAYNTAHDDDPGQCVGLWSDVGSKNVTYDHNTVYDESEGIRVEISSLHTVTNNTVYGCAGGAAGQIVSAQSTQIDIEGNAVTGIKGAPGIIVNYSTRNPPVPLPTSMTVRHNTVTITGPQSGVELWDFRKPPDAGWEVAGLYDDNTYCVPASWDGGWAAWGKGDGYAWTTFAGWQANPSAQDPQGQVITGPCP
ncbi:MAG: right-handed parallel beta-helix repeat-containing protein [Myxococcales bacterium]